MKISVIEKYFEENVIKKSLKEISWYEEKVDGILIKKHLINSQKQVFDFDQISDSSDIIEGTKEKLKTSDTIYFKNNKVIFVEFKSGGIGERDFRLKATESIISFYNFIFKNGIKDKLCIPNDIFEFYMVFDKNNPNTSNRLNFFMATERKLQIKYKHLFSNYHIIDNDKFQKRFKI